MLYSAKETYNLIDPTTRSHPISVSTNGACLQSPSNSSAPPSEHTHCTHTHCINNTHTPHTDLPLAKRYMYIQIWMWMHTYVYVCIWHLHILYSSRTFTHSFKRQVSLSVNNLHTRHHFWLYSRRTFRHTQTAPSRTF